MHTTYHKDGLTILAFLCNQFGKQEPGTNEEIKAFAAERGAEFQLMDKVKVNGSETHPVYKFLRSKLGGTVGSFLPWNFTKFLCDRNGVPIKRFGPRTDPLQFEDTIQTLLAQVAAAAAKVESKNNVVDGANDNDDNSEEEAVDEGLSSI